MSDGPLDRLLLVARGTMDLEEMNLLESQGIVVAVVDNPLTDAAIPISDDPRIEALESRIKILECEPHEWNKDHEETKRLGLISIVSIKCHKCGKTMEMHIHSWHKLKLEQSRF